MLMATLRDGRPAPAPSQVMVASAKPFIPNLADGTGPPLPSAPGRPSTRITAEPANDVTSSSGPSCRVREPPPRLRGREAAKDAARGSANDASADASPSPSPPSAGFPPSESGALGLMSGRGLY